MASTREERMQQRLRGAQRRQVKDVDFGLTFAPLPALESSPVVPAPTRRSPRSSLELAPQPSSRPTPSNRSRSQPPILTPADENARLAVNPSEVYTNNSTKHANISAKRRKLDTDETSTSIRSSQSSLPAPRRDVYALEEDEQPEIIGAESTNRPTEEPINTQPAAEVDTSFAPQTVAESPTLVLGEEEITESPMHAPGSGQRTWIVDRAATQSFRLQDELQVDNALQSDPASSPISWRKRKRATPDEPRTAESRRTRISEISDKLHEVDEVDELSPDQPKRGRRRRSSIQRESLSDAAAEASEEAAEEVDAQAATTLQKNRSRRVSRRRLAQSSPDMDEPSEFILPMKRQREHLPPAPSPAKQRHPKTASRKSKPTKKQAKKQTRSGSPIPVTVHRLNGAPSYNEDGADADILNSEIPYSNRGGVNVIDVLNKLCSEIIDSALETLKDSSRNTEDAGLKREYRNKHKVVETFRREFQNRLLDHTINLDNTAALERRVRDEQKRKLALRENILRVRAERQQIALRMDEIRMKNERESKEAQDRDTLNNAVHDIELAVERGKDRNSYDPAVGPGEKLGSELLLKRIAGEVSNKSDSGGILKQIKDFNAFLERTALVLEGRKG